jgi:hypothetical protein
MLQQHLGHDVQTLVSQHLAVPPIVTKQRLEGDSQDKPIVYQCAIAVKQYSHLPLPGDALRFVHLQSARRMRAKDPRF